MMEVERMKVGLETRKVVIRHLPPSLARSDLLQQIDHHFAGRYNWFSFRPGKNSHKHQRYSRAYIDFKCPGDVFVFAEFFDGHVFVNEKGSQHKAIVEYAPSQRVPRSSTKRDGREGTIYKDPEYLELLILIAKPTEHLPSAEIQLERKEAEQAGPAKETPIVTPLMEHVRQKRAVDNGAPASSVVAKISRRARAASPGKPGSVNIIQGFEKKKYVQKDNAKSASQKDKSAFIVVPRRADQPAASSIKGISEIKTLHGIEGPISGIPLTSDSGKKKILLLKGKEREIPNFQVTDGGVQQQNVQSGNSPVSTAAKRNQRHEASGRLIRSILLNNESRQNQSTTAAQQKIQILGFENGKRTPRPVNARSGLKGPVSDHDAGQVKSEGVSKMASDEKLIKRDPHGLGSVGEKTEKRTRNKDRRDRGVWTPLRHSEILHAVSRGEMEVDVLCGNRSGEFSASAGGHSSSSVENGSEKHFGRRGASYTVKDDGAVSLSEGKPPKRGVAGHSAQEKQVWVQKSSSGS